LAKRAAAFIVQLSSNLPRGTSMNWFEKNSKAIQAVAACATVAFAFLALIGVKLQIDASFESQREQSARDIYREFLNISISNPDFAKPNYCELRSSPKMGAYSAYVDYLLYAAEQSIEMDPSLQFAFDGQLKDHMSYLCSDDAPDDYQGQTKFLLMSFKAKYCNAVKICNN
jgi:hypothetical protein